MRPALRSLTPVIACILASLPTVAMAAPGLYLTWNDCPLSAAAVADLAGPCVNSDHEELVVSFELAAATDSVIELDADMAVQTASAGLPDWWHYETGGCRNQMLVATADFTGRTACTDFWQGEATFGGAPVYTPGAPRG